MALSGDFRELARLAAAMSGIEQKRFMRGAAQNVAAEAQAQIAESFARQVDPSNRPWKRSKRVRTQGGQTLSDNGRLRASFQGPQALESVTERSILIKSNVKYAAIHNYGGVIRPNRGKYLVFTVGGQKVFAKSVKIPKRQIVPDGKAPPRWEKAIKGAIIAHMNVYMAQYGIDL